MTRLGSNPDTCPPLPMFDRPAHAMGSGAPDPGIAARQSLTIAARLSSPMRPLDRTSDPLDGLALFDAVRSPVML